jgi:uncharacterized YccA/Bax inhibitor family protein
MEVIHTSAAKWDQAALAVLYALLCQMSIGAIAFALLGETSSATLRVETISPATITQSVFGTVTYVKSMIWLKSYSIESPWRDCLIP